MSRLLVDTNIVLDLLAKREPFYAAAARLFSLADQKKLKLFVTSLTFANTHYVLSRMLSTAKSREILRRFRVLVRVLSVDKKITDLALNDNDYSDFEDGLQYYAALENHQDIIISRDKAGFLHSAIPCMTAEEFLNMTETQARGS
jgi:predicted nucleic acid-binding protein